jgi:hypothetical protein
MNYKKIPPNYPLRLEGTLNDEKGELGGFSFLVPLILYLTQSGNAISVYPRHPLYSVFMD